MVSGPRREMLRKERESSAHPRNIRGVLCMAWPEWRGPGLGASKKMTHPDPTALSRDSSRPACSCSLSQKPMLCVAQATKGGFLVVRAGPWGRS